MKQSKPSSKTMGTEFFGWVTLSSKGQVAIPADIRKHLKLKTGERMLIVLRKDQDGLNLIKAPAVHNVFKPFTKN